MNLLDEHINSLGLTTAKNKLIVIAVIKYPAMLNNFKYFLGFMEYFESSIHYYAQIITLFQNFKTFFLKSFLIASEQKKVFASKTKLFTPIDIKLASFQTFKKKLSEAV